MNTEENRSGYKIPSPDELAGRELANLEIERAGEIVNLQNEIAATGARIMSALEEAFANGKIRSSGSDLKIDDLAGKAIDLFDEAHCELLQKKMNELLAAHGWQCEIIEATCSLYIYPAPPAQ